MNLAEIIRSMHASGNKLTRNEIKVMRAKLRRAGVTRLHKEFRGPYTVNVTDDVQSDTRADIGTVVVQVAAIVTEAA